MQLGDWFVVACVVVPFVFLALRLERVGPTPLRQVCELVVDLAWNDQAVYQLHPERVCRTCAHAMKSVDVVHYPNETFTVSCPYCEAIVQPTSVRVVKGGLTMLEFER